MMLYEKGQLIRQNVQLMGFLYTIRKKLTSQIVNNGGDLRQAAGMIIIVLVSY